MDGTRDGNSSLRLDDLQAGVDRLGHQARLVVQGIETADVIERDRQLVRRAFESRFPVDGTG